MNEWISCCSCKINNSRQYFTIPHYRAATSVRVLLNYLNLLWRVTAMQFPVTFRFQPDPMIYRPIKYGVDEVRFLWNTDLLNYQLFNMENWCWWNTGLINYWFYGIRIWWITVSIEYGADKLLILWNTDMMNWRFDKIRVWWITVSMKYESDELPILRNTVMMDYWFD